MNFSVIEVKSKDAKRVTEFFRNSQASKNRCRLTVQSFELGKSFVKIFHPDEQVREAFLKEINSFLQSENQSSSSQCENQPHTAPTTAQITNPESPAVDDEEKYDEEKSQQLQQIAEASEKGAKDTVESVEYSLEAEESLSKTVEDAEATSETLDSSFYSIDESPHVAEEGSSEPFSDSVCPKILMDSLPHKMKDKSDGFDPFNCEVVTVGIERKPKEFKDLLLLRPYAAQFLHAEFITRGTALQNKAWPDLFAKKSIAIIGPQQSGKTFAFLPIVLTMCIQKIAVILTGTMSRASHLVKLANYHQLSIEVQRPPQKIRNTKKQVLVCTPNWFIENQSTFRPSVIVFDRLDRMVDSALDMVCVSVAEAFTDVPMIATARCYSNEVTDTLDMMNIRSLVMVPCIKECRKFKEYLVSLDDLNETNRYTVLLTLLKLESKDNVVLIFLRDEAEIRKIYTRLDEDALCPYNLHETLEEEQLILRSHLKDGIAGVYLGCLADHRWLYTTKSVDTLINYRPPECAQAYRYRRQRLRPGGKLLTMVRAQDMNEFPEELFHILSNLTGYSGVDGSIEKAKTVFVKERDLRMYLKCVLLN